MSIIGIVCEYNPFHNGHEYQIRMSRRQLGEDAPVVCVMSGDFVQRGDAALYSKFARAEAACLCGADLVVELPLPWALSSAEGFARGAVGLLGELGVTHLSFGSEAGEIEPLQSLADMLLEGETTELIKKEMAKDASISFAVARQRVIESKHGPDAELLACPNNILAVEYLKAIKQLEMNISPVTVERVGSGHDQSGGVGPRSASEIRNMISNNKDISEHVPPRAKEIFERENRLGRVLSDREKFETALVSRLRMFDEQYFSCLPDAGDGLGNRLYKAVQVTATYSDILAATKTKRYALARIRRMCICAALGIKSGMNDGVPPYARVLAATEKGFGILRNIKQCKTIPVITKPASVRQLSSNCIELFAGGASAHDMFVLGYMADNEKKAGQDWRTSPKIVGNYKR